MVKTSVVLLYKTTHIEELTKFSVFVGLWLGNSIPDLQIIMVP